MEKEQREMGHAASTIDALSSRRHLLAVKTFFWLLGVDSQKHLARLYVKSALVFLGFFVKLKLIHLLQVTASDCPFYKKHRSLHKVGRPHSVQVPSLCLCMTHKCDLFFRMFEKGFSGKPFWRFNGAIWKSWPLSCCRTSHLSTLAVP